MLVLFYIYIINLYACVYACVCGFYDRWPPFFSCACKEIPSSYISWYKKSSWTNLYGVVWKITNLTKPTHSFCGSMRFAVQRDNRRGLRMAKCGVAKSKEDSCGRWSYNSGLSKQFFFRFCGGMEGRGRGWLNEEWETRAQRASREIFHAAPWVGRGYELIYRWFRRCIECSSVRHDFVLRGKNLLLASSQ